MANKLKTRNVEQLYSLAHLTLINCTPAELTYIAARVGYDAISPRFIQMPRSDEFPGLLDMAKKALKTALAVTGIKVLDIEIARITEDCDPRKFEPAFQFGGDRSKACNNVPWLNEQMIEIS